MKLSTAKDKVLAALVSTDHKAYSNLQIDKFLKQAALKELEKGGYVAKVLETSTIGSGNIKTYEPGGIEPLGKHFIDDKKSFRQQEKWDNLKQFLKDYLAAIALLVTITWYIVQTRILSSEVKESREQLRQLQKQLDKVDYQKSDTTNKTFINVQNF